MRIRGNVDGPYSTHYGSEGREGLGDNSQAVDDSREGGAEGILRGGAANEVKRKWTLIYDGKTKLYTLRDYRKAGETWYRGSELQYTELTGALEQIRKSEAADERR